MVATTHVCELSGSTSFAGATKTDLTADQAGTGRYKNNDTPTVNANDPCVVPAAAEAWSFWKTHYLQFSGSGYTITNVRWFVTGGPIGGIGGAWLLGTNGKIGVGQKTTGDNGLPLVAAYHGTDSYVVASGTTESGASMDVSHTYYKTASSNYRSAYNSTGADLFVSATPLTVDNTTTYSASQTVSKGVVTQVQISSNATQGTKAPVTYTWRYAES